MSNSPASTSAPESIAGDLALTVATEDRGPCEKRLAITVGGASVAQRFEETLRELTRTLHLPGFRPGKAPRKLIERRFADRVKSDVRDALHEAGVKQVLDAKGWQVLGQPTIEHDHAPDVHEDEAHKIEAGADYVFAVAVDIRPAIQLPDLGGLSVSRPSVEVTDQHVDAEVRKIREERGQWVPAEGRGATAGDLVVFDAQFLVDDAVVHTSQGGETVLPLEAGEPRPGYEWVQKLEGKKVGGKLTHKGTLPPDLPAEAHRGAKGTIKVEVRAIKAMELPPFDAAWLADLGVDSEATLRTRIREQLEGSVGRRVEELLDDRILAALLERTPVELPRRVVEREAEAYLRRYEVALRSKRVAEDEIPGLLEEARTQRTAQVESGFRRFLVLDELAKREKVFVTEDDVAARLAEMAAHYGQTVAQLEAEMEARDMLRDLRHELREEKVRRLLRSKVKIEG
jgi:trigger factor